MALGPAAEQVGLLSLVMFIVFTGLAPDPGLSIKIAGLVLAGGLLQVGLAAIPWPRQRFGPERAAIATVYRQLSEYARRPMGTTAAPPVNQALIRARGLLTDLGRDGSGRGEALWAPLNQAERVRLEITALSGLCEHLSVDAHETAWVLIDHALSSAASVLAAIVDGVLSDRAATTSAGATFAVERAVDALRTVAAERDAASRDAIAAREAAGRIEALAGQLRSRLS